MVVNLLVDIDTLEGHNACQMLSLAVPHYAIDQLLSVFESRCCIMCLKNLNVDTFEIATECIKMFGVSDIAEALARSDLLRVTLYLCLPIRIYH